MGYIRHHAIVVTSWNEKLLTKVEKKAIKIFGERMVSSKLISNVNRYQSIFIAPDGSKEFWDESDTGDKNRKKFIKWINKQAYSDGSNCLSYCEFYYGDSKVDSEVVSHN